MSFVSPVPAVTPTPAPAQLSAQFSTNQFRQRIQKTQKQSGAGVIPPWNILYGSCMMPPLDGTTAAAGGGSGGAAVLPEARCVFFGGGVSVDTASTVWLATTTQGDGGTFSTVWTQLALKNSQALIAPPRILPLMIGLSPTQFLMFGGYTVASETKPALDAYIGVIGSSGGGTSDTTIWWDRVKVVTKNETSSATPFQYNAEMDAPNMSTSTFMRTDFGDLVIVYPHPIGNFNTDGTSYAVGPRDDIGQSRITERKLVVTRIYLERLSSNVVTAEYGYLSAADKNWPSTRVESVRMAPLSCGFALGLTIPRDPATAASVNANTWVLSLQTMKANWSPSDGGAVVRWFNFGTLPHAPSLRSGMLLFSTGCRLSTISKTCIVASYGARIVWKSALSSKAPIPLHVAIFKVLSSNTFTISWQQEYTKSFDSDDVGEIGDVAVSELVFPNAKMVTGFSGGLELSFLCYGGYGRESEGRASIVTQLSIPPERLVDPTGGLLTASDVATLSSATVPGTAK